MQYSGNGSPSSSFPTNDYRMYGWNLSQLTPLLGMGSSLANSMGYGNLGKMLGTANQFMGNLPSTSPQNWGGGTHTFQPLNPLTWGSPSPSMPQAGWGNPNGLGWLGQLFGGNYNTPTGYNGWPLQNTGALPLGMPSFFPQGNQGSWPGNGLF
ncbi:hypothetical protein GCM10011391_10270 [Pullulanibacillus camelliae]|uniref:Uncharacterized protein n=1 Tax=Pullulanibacillus camelliae TaxID=1707096 RepID=A0A8J2YBK0_9BACL|nr:hypothetical protein [Pullulanibacillus camelliae]GGE33542.1 hypothetical protein GCM10011391_10270 [Pullulanibacillus camelliae]